MKGQFIRRDEAFNGRLVYDFYGKPETTMVSVRGRSSQMDVGVEKARQKLVEKFYGQYIRNLQDAIKNEDIGLVGEVVEDMLAEFAQKEVVDDEG
jgi:hypothetical protein